MHYSYPGYRQRPGSLARVALPPTLYNEYLFLKISCHHSCFNKDISQNISNCFLLFFLFNSGHNILRLLFYLTISHVLCLYIYFWCSVFDFLFNIFQNGRKNKMRKYLGFCSATQLKNCLALENLLLCEFLTLFSHGQTTKLMCLMMPTKIYPFNFPQSNDLIFLRTAIPN